MLHKIAVWSASGLIILSTLLILTPLGGGWSFREGALMYRIVPALTSALIVVLVRIKARRRQAEEEPFDERSQLILEKAARFTYSAFYIGALLAGNTTLIMSRFGNESLRYVSMTLYISVAALAITHRLAYETLKRRLS